jgi:hypothetical protein
MEQGIGLSFVKTSEFRGGFEPSKPPSQYATACRKSEGKGDDAEYDSLWDIL